MIINFFFKKEKIQVYEERIQEIQKMIEKENQNLKEIPDVPEEVQNLISSMINNEGTKPVSSSFQNTAFSSNLSSEDLELQKRFEKFKQGMPNNKPLVTDADLQAKMDKLTGGNWSVTQSIPAYDPSAFEDPSEEEQIKKIIMQAEDEARLDIVAPSIPPKKEQKDLQSSIPTPFPTSSLPSTQQKKQPTKSKKQKKKKKGSESESSSSSSDIENDPDFVILPTDNEMKKKQKEYFRKMYNEEKARKAQAYKEWKKQNF